MIELRISGATPADLLKEASQVLMLLAAGAKSFTAPPQSAAVDVPTNDPFPASDNVGATEAEPLENPKAGGRPRGRKPKAEPQTIDAEPLQKADFLDEPTAEAPKATVTVDEVKQAVRLALDNAQARLEAEYPDFSKLKGKQLETANQDILAKKVAYVKPLLAKFGAGKVTELKPEQYADFVAAAQAYIDGEA